MKLTIVTIEGDSLIKMKDGTERTKYMVVGTDEEGNHHSCDVFFKPVKGETYDGEMSSTTWGKTFKKTKAPFTGGGFKNDPGTRLEIMRQNALGHAVARGLGIARLRLEFMGNMPPDEVQKVLDETLSCEHLVRVAAYFTKFSAGEIKGE